MASGKGHLDCVAFLLEQRADVTLCDEVRCLFVAVFSMSVVVNSIFISLHNSAPCDFFDLLCGFVLEYVDACSRSLLERPHRSAPITRDAAAIFHQ